MASDVSSPADTPSTIGPDIPDIDGLGTFSMDDGETLVIYDRSAVEAWLSSDTTCSLEAMR